MNTGNERRNSDAKSDNQSNYWRLRPLHKLQRERPGSAKVPCSRGLATLIGLIFRSGTIIASL